MNWFEKLIMSEIFQSVISGVILLIFSEYFKNFILEPVKEFNGIIGKIDNKLKYYSNRIVNSGLPENFINEARIALRELSCDLESTYKQIPLWSTYIFIFHLPCKKQIVEAATKLIYLSNAAGDKGEELKNNKEIKIIRKLLRIEEL